MFKTKIIPLALLLSCFGAHSASLSITGNQRFGSNMFVNMDLDRGQRSDSGNTSSFLEHRILLRPDILIDEHFTVKTEWNLLQLNQRPTGPTTTAERFGSSLDSRSGFSDDTNYIEVSRAYLQWSSDWGIFYFGRMPKTWGLGLMYDSGDNPLDDYSTTVDRMAYQSLLGSLELIVAYEKGEEGTLNNDDDDMDVFEGSLEYANPEAKFNIGLLYSRKVRSADSYEGSILGRKSSHEMSLFLKKQWSEFFVGSEFVTQSYDKQSNVTGWLGQISWTPGNFIMDLDLAYSNFSGDRSFEFNRNYRPFLIMFRQTTGVTSDERETRTGGPVGGVEGNGTGGGVMLSKLGLGYKFSDGRYVLRSDVGYAQFEEQGTSSGNELGVEWDMSFDQQWYKNFHTQYAFGVLFPGDGYGPDARLGWGLQLRGYLEF
ncbi:hypothetical protein GW915_03790 [bacterium]|nr:hypothetical protein [bacterium]